MQNDSWPKRWISSNPGTVFSPLREHENPTSSGGAPFNPWVLLLLALILVGGPASAYSGGQAEAMGDGGLENADRSFFIAFPPDFTVSTDAKALARESYFPLDDGFVRLGGCYSGRDYEGTNFGSACVVVSVSPAREQDRNCARFDGDTLCGDQEGVRDVVVNSLRFKRADLSDAAVGHRLEARDYWTVRDGKRYDIRLFVSYTDIGMYSPGEMKEFPREEGWARLTAVLNSFSFR